MTRPASPSDAPPVRGLISRLTHALGTPLGSVQISAELLARDPEGRLGERERRLVENIRIANAEVQDLLRRVGRLVRAGEGRLRLAVEEVDARELLADVERRLDASLGIRAAAVEIAAPAPAVRFAADREVLAEVVESLVAVLFSGAGASGGRTTVRSAVEPAAPEAATAALVVVGRGAVPRLGEADFEPLADSGAEHGLALALARALVEAQHGTLAVEPAAEGTTFRLTLPLAASEP